MLVEKYHATSQMGDTVERYKTLKTDLYNSKFLGNMI